MRSAVVTALLLLLALNTGWFVLYSAGLGARGLFSGNATVLSRVFAAGQPVANVALAAHMIAGAFLTIGAPLQAIPALRRRWPRLHRRAGYTLFGLAIATGIGGLAYIALVGTIGGWWMSICFAIYGAAILWSAVNTVKSAREREWERHFRWATRLIILAVGSWIYRMHYVIWYGLTDGIGSNAVFTGLFDRVQVLAFFVPYLLVAEWLLRRGPQMRAAR